MNLMTLTKRMAFAAIILMASGCSEDTIAFNPSVDEANVSLDQQILNSVAKESTEALQSVLRSTRLELLNKHREEISYFNGADSAKTALRAKLKGVRKLVHIRHAQLLKDYRIKSSKRIGEILLSSL